jgi:hypothetical protein
MLHAYTVPLTAAGAQTALVGATLGEGQRRPHHRDGVAPARTLYVTPGFQLAPRAILVPGLEVDDVTAAR